MAKLFSGLTLLAALAAIFFGFQSKELVGKLQVAAEREHTDLLSTRDKLKKTEKDLTEAKKELEDTKTELASTKDSLTKAKEDLTKKEGELAAATEEKKTAVTQYETVKKSFDELKATFGDKDPAQIVASIAEMEETKKVLTAKVTELESRVAELDTVNKTMVAQKKATESKFASQEKTIERYKVGIMQKGLRGHVLAVNSGWGFCVISLGDRQGAAANKTLIVARNGQSIGRVKIINVEASQSVADIIPSSFARGTYVEPGDEVVFTGEDKVREEAAPATPAGTAAPAGSTAPGVPALPIR